MVRIAELFAGIGGYTYGFKGIAKPVFASERNIHAQKSFKVLNGFIPNGDIHYTNLALVPDHDILCSVIKFRPFNVIKYGKPPIEGKYKYEYAIIGSKFYYVLELAIAKGLPILFLDFPTSVLNQTKSTYFDVIVETLTEIGYDVYHEVLNSNCFVPQNRPRVYFVCVKKGNPPFIFPPQLKETELRVRDILEKKVSPKYTLKKVWEYFVKNKSMVKYYVADVNGFAHSITPSYWKNWADVLIQQEGPYPRKLTRREIARVMGFPEKMKIVASHREFYKQMGNTVVPAMVSYIGSEIVKYINVLEKDNAGD